MTWLSVIGSASALTGIILLTFGAVQDTNPVEFDTFGTTMPTVVQQRQDALNKQKTFYTAGAALLGGGALLAITGIVAASMLRTSVKFYSDGQLALRLPGKARLDLAPLQVRF